MAFLSAECALGSGDTHPFMALLETDWRDLCPFGSIEMEHMVHPTNQAAFLRVVYLMRFVCRRFPWTGRLQHLADAEHPSPVLSRPRDFYWELSPRELAVQCFKHCYPMPPAEKMMLFAILVPGCWNFSVEEDLGYLLTAYCFVRRLSHRGMGEDHGNTLNNVKSAPFGKAFFSSRKNEEKLITLLRDNDNVSSPICGGGLCLLLDIVRQRRRRVLQVNVLCSAYISPIIRQHPAYDVVAMLPDQVSCVLMLFAGQVAPLFDCAYGEEKPFFRSCSRMSSAGVSVRASSHHVTAGMGHE